MNKKQKIQALKESLPHFWNSYQHMYDVRDRNSQSMINFLLLVATFLPILSITLYTTDLFNNHVILIPVIFQFLAILILLRGIFVNNSEVAWMALDKKLLKSFENDDFVLEFISTLKQLERRTWYNMLEMGKIVRISRYLIVFSLFAFLMSTVFTLLNGSFIIYFLTLVIFGLFSYLITKLYILDKQDTTPEFNSSMKTLREWLNEK